MIRLRERQSRFLAALVEGSDASDLGAGPGETGMDIYRNNYRSALIGALESTFERTARLAGREAFRQAAIHHVIAHPPTSWTLDVVGQGFAGTCRALFVNDPDVAEIAWLEWAMACSFTSRDTDVISLEDFERISAAYDDSHWTQLRLSFLPALTIGSAQFDLTVLWRSLAETSRDVEVAAAEPGQRVVVWRDGERPVFRLMSESEAYCLETMQSGAAFGEICEHLAVGAGAESGGQQAAAMLRKWLSLSLVESVIVCHERRKP